MVDNNTSNFSTYDTSLTIAWLVSDTGGSGLSNVQVWRQIDGGGWSNIHQESISGSPNSDSWVNTVTCGHNYEYGVHVVDKAGNVGQEVSRITATVQCNQPPQVQSLEIEYGEYCDILTGQGLIGFKWIYQDNDNHDESRFDFRINNINNVNDLNPEVDRTYGSLNNPSGSTNAQQVLVKSPLEADKISFNKTYYWWVRVWDSIGADSGWVSGQSTTTPLHAHPDPDFTWSPSSPSVDEIVQLCAVQTGVCGINESTCYNASNAPISCSSQAFEWSLPSGVEFASTSAASTKNPQIKFTDSIDYEITLKITDDVGSCSQSHQIQATLPLPEWGETTP